MFISFLAEEFSPCLPKPLLLLITSSILFIILFKSDILRIKLLVCIDAMDAQAFSFLNLIDRVSSQMKLSENLIIYLV
jgi:hypothetical protein